MAMLNDDKHSENFIVIICYIPMTIAVFEKLFCSFENEIQRNLYNSKRKCLNINFELQRISNCRVKFCVP